MFNQNPNLMYTNAGGNQMANSVGHAMLGSYNALPNDLDPSLYQNTSELDCDIDSVIKKELSLEGDLDFNFDHSNFDTIPHSSGTATSTNNTISNPTQSCVH